MTQKPLAYLARNPQTIIQRNIVPGSRMFNDVGFPQVRELLRTAMVDQGISLAIMGMGGVDLVSKKRTPRGVLI